MASALGEAILSFGTVGGTGSNEASVAVTGQASILATSNVEAWVMADDTTSNHTANDHRYFPVFASITCGTPSAGTGFTIYARSAEKLSGDFKVRWVWSD